MAGLIARLLGGRPQPGSDEAATAGMGGVTAGPGPAGESGFPGSTSAVRTFKGASPRAVKIEADRIHGFDQGFTGFQVTQASRKPSEGYQNPRETPYVATPQPDTIASLRQSPAEWYGGVPMRTDAVAPANQVIGGNPLSGAAAAGGHSVRDTETPATDRQPQISGNVPGSQNVRNTRALRYQAAPGQLRSYRPAPRPDAPQAAPVTVESRFVFDDGGVQTWSMLRQMPYTGRGDGGRGADLDGSRYYAEGAPAFSNAGAGSYGIARLQGPVHRPVSFTEPAPWSANYYDTTAGVGTPDNPGTAQPPDLVHISPEVSRAALVNRSGRR